MLNLIRLQKTLEGASLPISGVSIIPPERTPDDSWYIVTRPDGIKVRVDWSTPPSSSQQTQAQTLINNLEDSPSAETTWQRSQNRTQAKRLTEDTSPDRILLRAILKILLDVAREERMYLSQLRMELIALGRNPAPAPGVRTWEQLVQAVKDRIDAGEGDATP